MYEIRGLGNLNSLRQKWDYNIEPMRQPHFVFLSKNSLIFQLHCRIKSCADQI